MRIALVHDYLREYGGAERVVETLHKTFPDAPVYTAFFDKDSLGEHASRFSDWKIHESRLTSLPFYKKLFSPYRVFSSWAFRGFDFSQFDVVISSTNMYMAKAVRVPSGQHLSYIHTPARSLYGLSTRTNWKKNPIIRVGGELINIWMRYLDFTTAQNPDVLLANSQTTKERIAKYYRREAKVVPPPVTMVDRLQDATFVEESAREYLLFVGRLVVSKHPEIAVAVAKELKLPLKVVGTGPMLDELKEQAQGSDTTFLGSVSDEELAQIYRHAKLVFFPAEDEDFGIVPIEALAAGTPVLAHFSGEPRYTILPGVNGEHVKSFELSEWVRATKKVLAATWSPKKVRATSEKYSEKAFIKTIHDLVY
jgi:glycosyltransferase involved in cell wall biosynthesis